VAPNSVYSWSKYFFERYVESTQSRRDILVQGFRYFNVYGPHEDHKDQPSPFHRFAKEAQETGVIKLFYGSNYFYRDFVPVELITDLHQKFFNVKESGVWNIGTGTVRSFQSVAEEIAAKYSAKIEYIEMPPSLKTQYQIYTCADLTKLKRTLGEANCS
jgi:ADP-L-glycero-D-manno-heptose 6-epimerase